MAGNATGLNHSQDSKLKSTTIMTNEQQPVAINQTAIALLRGHIENESRWLVVYDTTVEQHRLVEAIRLEDESFRESIDREVAWQLNLRRGKDYIVSSVPRLHLEIPIEITHGCSDGVDQRIDVVEFYLVELYGKQARATIENDPNVKWWKAEQFFSEVDGEGLLSRQQQILQLADILKEEHPNE